MPDYNALVVIDQQGEIMRVKSGGDVRLESSGKISVEAGGEIDNTAGAELVNVEAIGANATLTREDSGKIFLVNTDELVITLPPTVAGLEFTFLVEAAGLSAVTGLSISPNASDQFIGGGLTSTDDLDAINTAGTDAEGDLLKVIGDGVLGWYIVNMLGTWASE